MQLTMIPVLISITLCYNKLKNLWVGINVRKNENRSEMPRRVLCIEELYAIVKC